jgi:prostaglandin-H2 D-isomerase / glutathione transferase
VRPVSLECLGKKWTSARRALSYNRAVMNKLKLTYFDFPASRGEECRLALAVAGVDFEDNRIPRDDWPNLKPTTPFGSVPTLEEEGRPTLSECNAILSLIGRRYGLLPVEDDWETARLESILSACEALRHAVSKTFGIKDPEELKKVRQEFTQGQLKSWATHMEAQIKGPFVGGTKLSVADIKLFIVMGWFKKGVLDHIPADVFSGFSKLEQVFSGVKNHPAVVAWYSK